MAQIISNADFSSRAEEVAEQQIVAKTFDTGDAPLQIALPGREVDSVFGLIGQASEDTEPSVVVADHAAEPIKDIEDIYRIEEYLIAHERYRDNMLFIVGINFGLRVSDLRMLRFCDLIDDKLRFKERFPVWEIKTRNTKKRSTNRYITINEAVKESVRLYLEHTPGVKLDDYMFQGISRSNKRSDNKPMTVGAIYTIIRKLSWQVGVDAHLGTHSLRKTFCYHQMLMSQNDPRKLMLLSKMLNHSSIMQTMTYIGITDDEIAEAYKGLNLGGEHSYHKLMGELREEPLRGIFIS